ncbi:sterol desaturase family protein [Plesiocystis pacifica]|uniref:sterol desaturase family protein n=1 Tax=Plesiocystis pacifica TaxID=191768 RepID=UPI000309BDAD|nr:sterol desaturase family protein [Plesiocystis pacifica]
MDIEWVWRPLVHAALIGCLFAPLEWLLPEREPEPGAEPEPLASPRRRTDAAFATIGAVLTEIALFLVLGWTLAQAGRWTPEALVTWEPPLWLSLAAGLLIFELAGYAYHRAAHALPLLWRLHRVHHSAPRMDWLASFRQHPVEIVLVTLAQNLPLVLLGIPLGAHALVVVLLTVNTAFVHSDLRVNLGPLRGLVATPRFHHRHHDRAGAPRNFAALLPAIDLLFGTYSDERATDFGVDEPTPTSFWGLLASPFGRRQRGALR